jgi:hypothetical protein
MLLVFFKIKVAICCFAVVYIQGRYLEYMRSRGTEGYQSRQRVKYGRRSQQQFRSQVIT